MKWKNKGHEYDKYRFFENIQRVYIYGAGDIGKYAYGRLRNYIQIDGFIDNSEELKGKDYDGVPVIDFLNVTDNEARDTIIILAAKMNNLLLFAKQCRAIGFIDGETLFYWEDFANYYLDIFLFYNKDKLYADFISLQICTVCNLNCKGCLAFNPENKNKKIFKYDEVCGSIDVLEKNIDYIHILDLCGGEPFLHKEFYRIIEYAREKLGSRIEVLRTVTNGTIVPSAELCHSFVKNNVTVLLDDYRGKADLSDRMYLSVLNTLKNEGVDFVENKVDRWIDLGVSDRIKSVSIYDETHLHSKCQDERRTLFGNRLFACDYAGYALQSEVISENDCESIILDDSRKGAVLLEFLKGYTDSGSAGMCKYCSGSMNINHNFIHVAEQNIL